VIGLCYKIIFCGSIGADFFAIYCELQLNTLGNKKIRICKSLKKKKEFSYEVE